MSQQGAQGIIVHRPRYTARFHCFLHKIAKLIFLFVLITVFVKPSSALPAAPHTSQGGLLVAPILQVLLLNRDPGPVLDWADRVAKWPFRRVIPCHLANDVATTPQEFRKAFRFLEKGSGGGGVSKGGGLLSLFSGFNGGGAAEGGGGAQPLAEDLQFLRDAEKTLVGLGTLFPAADPVDRASRR